MKKLFNVDSLKDLVGLHIKTTHIGSRAEKKYEPIILDTSIYLDSDIGMIELGPGQSSDYVCCVIQHISYSEALQDATILSIEDMKISSYNEGSFLVIDNFGHRIKTTKGTCTIELRAEHSGDYSGYVKVLGCYYYIDEVNNCLYNRIPIWLPSNAKILQDF